MRDLLNLIPARPPRPNLLRSLIEDAGVSSFARWFAGSQCVNDDGSPKRMFHGTGAGDIKAFDPARIDPNGLYGPGFYFTDSTEVAGSTGKIAFDPIDPWPTIDAGAAYNQTGYAFARPRFEVAPLTKRQMYQAFRTLNSNEMIDGASRDIGARKSLDAGWRAYEEGPEAMARWLATSAPDYLVQKIKAVRQRLTTPAVLPVYLSIKRPFDTDAYFDAADVDGIAAALVPDPERRQALLDVLEGRLGRGGLITGRDLWMFLRDILRSTPNGRLDDGAAKAATNAALQRAGFDGIRHDGGQIIATFGEHDVWIAFHPNQIKSVYARSHTDSPNIDESTN